MYINLHLFHRNCLFIVLPKARRKSRADVPKKGCREIRNSQNNNAMPCLSKQKFQGIHFLLYLIGIILIIFARLSIKNEAREIGGGMGNHNLPTKKTSLEFYHQDNDE